MAQGAEVFKSELEFLFFQIDLKVLYLAAVICGCMRASHKKAWENLFLLLIGNEWAGQRMEILVVGYKRSVLTMKVDYSDLWQQQNCTETQHFS